MLHVVVEFLTFPLNSAFLKTLLAAILSLSDRVYSGVLGGHSFCLSYLIMIGYTESKNIKPSKSTCYSVSLGKMASEFNVHFQRRLSRETI